MRFITYLFILISFSTFSQTTYTWDGDSDGDGDGIKWTNPLNWDLDQIPVQGSIVEIGSDSVILTAQVEIEQLILNSGGILFFDGGNEQLIITGSTGEGITINGGAKLYINGECLITNSAFNGIDLQVNSALTIMESGQLFIDGTASDGIRGGIAATFVNMGAVVVDGAGSDGLDLRHFINQGSIDIENCGGNALRLSGTVGQNSGSIDAHGLVSLYLSSSFSFVNEESGWFKARDRLLANCDFSNLGILDFRNNTTTGIRMNQNVTFSNANTVYAQTTTLLTFFLTDGATFENLEGAKVIVTPGPFEDFTNFVFWIRGSGTKVINRGEIDLDLGNKVNGFFLFEDGVLENYGDISLENYYDKGISSTGMSLNTDNVLNLDTAYFYIDESLEIDAEAIEFTSKFRVKNDSCAQFVVKDSIALQGNLGMQLNNFGYMEIEKFSKTTNAVFANEGAIFIADTSLAHHPDPTLISLITNNGLIATPVPGPVEESVNVSPFFAAINPLNVTLFFNQTYVKDSNTGQIGQEGGGINLSSNTWTPNSLALTTDTLVVFYRHVNQPCIGNYFTIEIPIVLQGCNPVTYTFNESVDNKWNNPNNWTPVGVPSVCDHAIIPNGTTCMLVISYPGYGVAKSLLVENGAVFSTQEGIILTIDPTE